MFYDPYTKYRNVALTPQEALFLIKERGIAQKTIAHKLQMHPVTVSRIFRGKDPISLYFRVHFLWFIEAYDRLHPPPSA